MIETTPAARFRQRLRARELLVGTWVKTPAPVVCEVLAGTGLDVLTLDAEHAPFGRAELDGCLAVCRALKNWELSEDIARLLIAREPDCWRVTMARVISEDSDELTIKRHNRFSFGS